MRKFLLTAFIGISAISLNAQNPLTNDQNTGHGYIYPDHVGISRPLREIWAEEGFNVDAPTEKELAGTESEDKKHTRRVPQTFMYNVDEHGSAYGNDESILQKEDGTRPSPGTKANWAGIGTGGMFPYDPTGAAGPNHYIQAVNATTYKIFNKTTGANMGSGQVGSLWSPATPNSGDPIVMYDRFADRWFISQFGTSGNKIYIAVSVTNDPTGSYYTYDYTSPQFPDYLKFSIWRDGYYMTANTGTQRVWAFERNVMLTGGTARAVYQSFSPPQGGGFFVPMPGDADGTTMPTSGGCPIFSYTDNNWGTGQIDGIRIYSASTTWGGTPSMSISQASGSPVATAAFDASYDSGWDDIPQPGTTQKLDGIGGILQYRAQFRVWSGYNTVVLNWPVRISASQRSIMWCELRQNQSTGAWSMYQQGTYTPDSYSRWVGSIAMDDGGNIALCYAKSGASTVYPSLGYTGRLASDPLGTMSFAETIAQAGAGSQTGGINRFGDYAQTTLDPDGTTFWHTGMYIATTGTGGGRTRIYSFQLSSSVSAGVTISSNDADNSICNGTSVTFTASPLNGGTSPSYQWKKNGGNVGTNSPTYTTSTLANGDVITCVMTSNLPSVINNPATSNAITMTVNNNVTPAVSIATSGGNTICSGTSKTFTATPTNGGTPSYQWKKNGGNVGTNSATYTTSTLANGDIITCVMTSSATCVTSSTATSNSITMTVNATPSTPSISSNSPLCSGETLNLTAPTVSGATYAWSATSYTSSQQNPTRPNATTGMSGVYSCTVTVNGCTSTAGTTTVTVNATPNTPTISANGNILTSSSATGNQWYLDGNLLPGETSQNITVTQAGNYTVIVTTNGCSSAASAPFASTVNVNEIENPYFLLVYPNPTEGDFNISFKAESSDNYTLEMFNEIGQVVISEKINNYSGSFILPVSMNQHAAGVYTIRISNGKTESVKKIVVNK